MEPSRVGERRRDLGEEQTQRLIINKQRGKKSRWQQTENRLKEAALTYEGERGLSQNCPLPPADGEIWSLRAGRRTRSRLRRRQLDLSVKAGELWPPARASSCPCASGWLFPGFQHPPRGSPLGTTPLRLRPSPGRANPGGSVLLHLSVLSKHLPLCRRLAGDAACPPPDVQTGSRQLGVYF